MIFNQDLDKKRSGSIAQAPLDLNQLNGFNSKPSGHHRDKILGKHSHSLNDLLQPSRDSLCDKSHKTNSNFMNELGKRAAHSVSSDQYS